MWWSAAVIYFIGLYFRFIFTFGMAGGYLDFVETFSFSRSRELAAVFVLSPWAGACTLSVLTPIFAGLTSTGVLDSAVGNSLTRFSLFF